MSFPPKWADFGKKTKDLFKKTYEYKKELKVINKANNGATIESWGQHDKNALAGFFKARWPDKNLGDLEVELNSGSEAKGKLVKKVSNVTLTFEGSSNASSCNVSAEAASSSAGPSDSTIVFTGKGNHNVGKSKTDTTFTASAVVGCQGIAVGGHVDFNANNPSAPTDYNLGAEYQQSDLTATIATSDKLNDITGTYFLTVNKTLSLGASLAVKPDSSSRLFTFGGEYDVDKATKLKFKADSNGLVGSSVTHTLSNPAVKILAAAEFNTQASDIFAPQKLGLSLTLGDF